MSGLTTGLGKKITAEQIERDCPAEVMSSLTNITQGRLTAEQIEQDCPDRLRQIAKEIEERLSKADKQAKQAEDHFIAVDRLLVEAKSFCDTGGFEKFRELFCPQLGKSQAYKLLSIAAGKKTFAENRAEERDRKRRTRANQKAAAANSGTVPEKKDAGAEQETLPAGVVAVARTGGEHEPAQARHRATSGDQVLLDFSARVMDLVKRFAKGDPERFAATSVSAENLANLGKFLTTVANIKRGRQSPYTSTDLSPELSAEETEYADNNERAAA